MNEELRKRIARIISPKTSFEDFDGVRPTQFQMDRRRIAYEKADAVIAALDPGIAIANQNSPPKAST